MDAATDLFARRGYARVSIQEIADQAQTHKTTVLYHFETKEALYGAVLDEAMGRMATVMHEFLAGDFAVKAVDHAIETHGGLGFTEEVGLIKRWSGANHGAESAAGYGGQQWYS